MNTPAAPKKLPVRTVPTQSTPSPELFAAVYEEDIKPAAERIRRQLAEKEMEKAA